MHATLAVAALLYATTPDPGTGLVLPQPAVHRTGQDVLTSRLPLYPGAARPDQIGDTMEAHGVPMNIQSFVTPDNPRDVLAFYKQAFREEHLPMLGDGDLLVRFAYPSITAFDETNEVDLSVIAIPSANHKLTTVLLALADMRGLHENVERAVAEKYGGLPPYPTGEGPHLLKTTDESRQQVMVSFGTPDSPEKVLSYYSAELGKQGFSPHPALAPNELELIAAQAMWRLSARADPTTKRTWVTATWSSLGDHQESAP